MDAFRARVCASGVRSNNGARSARPNTRPDFVFGGARCARTSRRREEVVTAQMVVWTSGFVLMSLVINAPLMTPLMTALRLNATSPIKQQAGRGARPGLGGVEAPTHRLYLLRLHACRPRRNPCCCTCHDK